MDFTQQNIQGQFWLLSEAHDYFIPHVFVRLWKFYVKSVWICDKIKEYLMYRMEYSLLW